MLCTGDATIACLTCTADEDPCWNCDDDDVCCGIGDFDRLRSVPPRERLRERPRIRAVIAPKKEASVGEETEREVDVAEAGECGGESWLVDDLDDWVVCEEAVFVRMGGGMDWLCEGAIIGESV